MMWDAIENKLDGADFFFGEMGRDLIPPYVGNPTMTAIAISSGAVVGHPWQRRFYHHLDAFLAITRSVPDIVRCCFGIDSSKPMRHWLSSLDPAEIARRKAFQGKFDKLFVDFKQLPLSGARNVTLHRSGVAPVEVQITGKWGVYKGGPLERVPESETPTIVAGNDPALMVASMQPPQSIEPRASDFLVIVATASGQQKMQLFPECKEFLQKAKNLVGEARKICQDEHGSGRITPPPY
jgi:hypothetical protein